MRANNVRKIWRKGGAVVNGWCGIPSGFAAEVLANQGFDSVTVDLQHGLVHYDSAIPMLQGISTTNATPMCRVPWLEEGIIMKMLDAGCYGIICPMINNADDAVRLGRSCRYPPKGYRSNGPARAAIYGGADYQPKANATVLAIGMIETEDGLKNLEAILKTKAMDAVYVGPSDLGLALGRKATLDQTDPVVVKQINHIKDTCKKYRTKVGIHCGSAEYAKKMVKEGFDLVTLSVDYRIMAAGAASMVQYMRKK
jgi:4-hydroxy-2-oxoheptanedioate aldolase